MRDRYFFNIDSLPSQRKLTKQYNDMYGKEETPEKKRLMERVAKNVTQKRFSPSTYTRKRNDSASWNNEDYKRGWNGGLATANG